jgi:hypothetical protein
VNGTQLTITAIVRRAAMFAGGAEALAALLTSVERASALDPPPRAAPFWTPNTYCREAEQSR